MQLNANQPAAKISVRVKIVANFFTLLVVLFVY